LNVIESLKDGGNEEQIICQSMIEYKMKKRRFAYEYVFDLISFKPNRHREKNLFTIRSFDSLLAIILKRFLDPS